MADKTTKSIVVGGTPAAIMAVIADFPAYPDWVEAAKSVPGAILPFPGGIVRSGSKVGGRTKGMMASTNDAYCPTLKGRAGTELSAEVARVAAASGVTTFRLTGGEPLLRPDIVEVVRRLAAIRTPGGARIDLAMTTNGVGLDRRAQALAR